MKKLYKIITMILVVALVCINCDVVAFSYIENVNAKTISGNSVSENDVDEIPDFDVTDVPVSVQGDSPANLYISKADCKCSDTTRPYIRLQRYPTQGKAASQLLDGEWMFDQDFSRDLLFGRFYTARKDADRSKHYRDVNGNWIGTIEALTNQYEWDEELEVVAMQRAAELLFSGEHDRPNGCHYSEVYLYCSLQNAAATGLAFNPNAVKDGSTNTYWNTDVNELNFVFCPSSLALKYPEKDFSTDAALADLIVTDPEIGYMEEAKGRLTYEHRKAIMDNDYYRIGIGCVRTSDGRIITAVALAKEDNMETGADVVVTPKGTHTSEQMENMFSMTYTDVTIGMNAKGTDWNYCTLTDVTCYGESTQVSYVEGTPQSKRPTLDLKNVVFGNVGHDAVAMWKNSTATVPRDGKNRNGNQVEIIDGTWIAENPEVATVDANGIITIHGTGTAGFYNKGTEFKAVYGIEVTEIPLPDFEFVPVFSSQEWDVASGTLRIPYTLVCKSYESEEDYGEVLSIIGRDISITSSNADVAVTNTVASDGMSGVVSLTYTGDKANIMDGVSGTQIVFGGTDKHLLNKYTLWMSISNSGSNNSSSTGNTNTDTEDTKDATNVVVKEKKQTISIGNSRFKKATKKSKAYAIKRSKVKKTKVYNMKVKVKTSDVGHGKVTYKVTYPKGTTKKQKKLFTVKKGKITIKKGVKKGTYKVTITAAKVSGLYKKATKTVYVKVK